MPEEKKNGKFKELKSGDVVKFTKPGESISGTFISIEESKQFANSYAVKLKVGDDIKVVFVSNIVADMLKTNNVQPGSDLMIEFTGKKTSEKSGMDYNTYKVYAA